MLRLAVAEELERLANGGDPNNSVTLELRDYDALVVNAYAKVLTQRVYDTYKEDGRKEADGQWLEEYTVPVVYAASLDEYIADLPVPVVSLPFNLGWDAFPTRSTKPFAKAEPQKLFLYDTVRGMPPLVALQGTQLRFVHWNPEVANIRLLVVNAKPESINEDVVADVLTVAAQMLKPYANIPEDKISDQNNANRLGELNAK